ncbi:D-lactate dehydrogenase [Eremomyces bilateralis CBS 781.70]|uniref:D-lactate dehydrogenase (cytochrome) n=1 Tax=Eremomyces bilateralis CBS 781.70 TaxID=1392243 RepID=A0A6G1GI28_9PEZI|nr:D-lactate dehydrogenase [Eremomyces bilateralis CBS 781.70]KAF1817632.1 D-lactate dehydrogenase [Eremomyces bilateralis CBS 781.70]
MAESLLRNPPDRSSTQSLEKSATAKYSVSPDTLRKAIGQLKKDIAADRIIRDVGECTNKSSTAWSPAPEETDCPSFIVYPISTLEVSKIAKVCHELGIPMLPYSGGTSLEGSLAMTTKGGCCIDFKLMDRVIGVNKKDMDVVVQPGVDYMELNQTLAEQNLFFPPDPGPGAKIGGMIAQGCSGTNAYRYGPMKEWVLGLTVVLADGTIIKTRHRPRKSSAGYDLTQLIVGSEGTLGIVTEASLKLTSKPQNVRVAVVAFPSIPNAVDSAIKVVQEDLPVAALELLDDFTMKAVNEAGYCEKQYAETATLFLKFSGYSDRMVQEIIGKVMDIAKANNCSSFEISKTEREASDLWQARKTALWSVLALRRKPEDKFLSSDAAVPISRLGDLIEATQADIKESGVLGSCIGHVGDGNFHAGILYDPQDEKIARTIIQNVQRRAVKMKGTVSGEHGIGLENRDALTEELGQQSIDTMRKVKAALDPKNLLNPDKIFHQKWVAKDSWIPFSSSASSKGYQDQDIVQDIKSTLGWS